eukprot:Em0001g3182a
MAERVLKPNYNSVELNKTVWEVPNRYQELQPLGVGAFSSVCSALDTQLKIRVAVKKLARPFQSELHAKRCYREVRLLKMFDHDNVIGLLDIFTPTQSFEHFSDVYLVTELMGSDLNKILQTQDLTDDHYIHSSGVVHRDLKPSNIAVSEDCEIKILDFGLGRGTAETMTGYVTTRYWRAPEVLLNWMHYDQKVDIWSVGCIMAELLTRKVLFPGYDYKDHLHLILQICGTPDAEFMRKIIDKYAQEYLASLPYYPRKDFAQFFAGANPQAIELLNRLLCMDPTRRPTAAEALQHPYMAKYYCPTDEPDCTVQYDDSFEIDSTNVEGWRRRVYDEILQFIPPTLIYQ